TTPSATSPIARLSIKPGRRKSRMTKNKAHHARSYLFRSGEPLLIDANVWLYLQPPPANPVPAHAYGYSETMKNILLAKARPLTEALILSEYLNRYLRVEHAAFASKYPKYKDFRKSPDYRPIAQAAVSNAKLIVKICCPEHTPLAQCNVAGILA